MSTQVVAFLVILLFLGMVGGFLLLFASAREQQAFRASLLAAQAQAKVEENARIVSDRAAAAAKRKSASARKGQPTLEDRFFQAGVFSDPEKREFERQRVICPIITTVLLVAIVWPLAGAEVGIPAVILGFFTGMQLPFTLLDRKIKRRQEEIAFFLPLVIEQLVIGVSSSLDIGPCIQRVVSMADERASHNPVTELLRYAQAYVKTGVSLEDALNEVGRRSGNPELNHTMMSLAQVARHGGEVVRRMEELADAVTSQRETRIEDKIKKLELVATGPVALVFVGFMIILLSGFLLHIKSAFGGL